MTSPARLSSLTMSVRMSRTSARSALPFARTRCAACALLRIELSGRVRYGAQYAQKAPPRGKRHLIALTPRLLFGLLALSNIERSSAHSNRPTGRVELDMAAPGDPAQ